MESFNIDKYNPTKHKLYHGHDKKYVNITTLKENYEILPLDIGTKYSIKLVNKMYFALKGLLFNGNKKCIFYSTTTEKANQCYKILTGLGNPSNIDLYLNKINCNTSKTNREK